MAYINDSLENKLLCLDLSEVPSIEKSVSRPFGYLMQKNYDG